MPESKHPAQTEESQPLWLIVGLGNPGNTYTTNRHNIGYWFIDQLARNLDIEMRTSRLYSLGDGTIERNHVLLCKPRTYVNNSGDGVSPLLKDYNLSPSSMLVICDDLNLPIGKLRLRPSGNHGGHNGLRSIMNALGRNDFPRLRIGIGRPHLDGQSVTDPDLIANYVLGNPSSQERQILDESITEALDTLVAIINYGLESAMNRFNH